MHILTFKKSHTAYDMNISSRTGQKADTRTSNTSNAVHQTSTLQPQDWTTISEHMVETSCLTNTHYWNIGIGACLTQAHVLHSGRWRACGMQEGLWLPHITWSQEGPHKVLRLCGRWSRPERVKTCKSNKLSYQPQTQFLAGCWCSGQPAGVSFIYFNNRQ